MKLAILSLASDATMEDTYLRALSDGILFKWEGEYGCVCWWREARGVGRSKRPATRREIQNAPVVFRLGFPQNVRIVAVPLNMRLAGVQRSSHCCKLVAGGN